MAGRPPPEVPRATYRLQFGRGFPFADAGRLLPYLDALGISHIYASPYLAARAGTSHGYDIVDHNAVNPELGGEAGLVDLADALSARAMGQILDFVPNHMGVGRADNAWWLDVLEWGRASPFAAYFDIDWEPAKPELREKVLLPFLGDTYGQVLERGELVLTFDAGGGSFDVTYHEHRFPIAPRQYTRIFTKAISAFDDEGSCSRGRGALDRLSAAFRALPTARAPRSRLGAAREKAAEAKAALADLAKRSPAVQTAIERALASLNGRPGDSRSFLDFHRLLERQNYRLTYWRVAADEINYRRFFDVNELAGLRVELPELFDEIHRLVFRLMGEGRLSGLRIDHIDGLFDPEAYCRRLAEGARSALARAGCEAEPYILVEKILAHHEHLAADWPVSGTTGYDFAREVGGLFVGPGGERPLDRFYRRYTGESRGFDEILYRSKRDVMETLLASELGVLGAELDRIAQSNWRTRDFTLNTLRDALKEVVANFPVYRTYVTGRGIGAQDRQYLDWAVARARKTSRAAASVFDFLYDVLTTDLVRGTRRGYNRRRVVRFAMKVQQFTGPVMAKGLEDTAFYRYARLAALNEVGGDPRRFGTSVPAFHHAVQERARHWPRAMLATSTHDTKWGEDARARIAVLSECAAEWSAHVRRWSARAERYRTLVDDRPAPARRDIYLLYEALVGSWPAELLGDPSPDRGALEIYGERIASYMVKAAREAKTWTNWAAPNAEYEAALGHFIARLLDPERGHVVSPDFIPFVTRIARAGALNSLAETALKLTLPGVPDLYQGSELWHLALVDPDNRRPVDYGRRVALLERLAGDFAAEARIEDLPRLGGLLESWHDGAIKLYAIWRLLAFRRRNSALFGEGGYLPLEARGARAGHVCAFARMESETMLITVVPRLVWSLRSGNAIGADPVMWGDTYLVLPPDLLPGGMTDLLTGARASPGGADGARCLKVGALLRDFPIAVLAGSA